MTDKPLNILFLCTGNSARSILAESILDGEGNGRFRAFSAGSHPKGAPHPLALETLKAMGYRSEGFRSKSWDEFTAPGAPEVDFIITVCDSAAGEACPIMRGPGKRAHWGVEDPSHVEGTEEERRRAFTQTATYLKSRIMAFINLHSTDSKPEDFDAQIKEIGVMEGATEKARKAD
ncbi:arsenate reductase ArsC [Martelella mediterranea]|uniref:Arsenate reductase n=1 Tax=Martelella mediterranea TaxID=293089 RepID=A0A4R3NHY1_9HYPH|nr:arsenate reductase ArsC [Martelella mediterranea]TCT33100.1 arsenate reductase [Martelella mediterranea]